MPGLGAGTAELFGDAHVPNSREPFSDDMENCAASGQAGIPGMGCFDNNVTSQMTARSMHEGGVFLMLADGSVRFVNDSIDAKPTQFGCGSPPRGVWQAIHTRAGREVVGEY